MQRLKPSLNSIEMPRTRGEKVSQREDAIISAARRMFNARGFAKTPMTEIAKASGVADGTVYLYFKNKRALGKAVLSKFYEDLTRAAQAGVDKLSSPPERIRFLAQHHLETVMSHYRLLEMLPLLDITIETYGGSDLYGLNRAYVSVFDRVTNDALTQGFIRNGLTPWVIRDIFFGSMDHGIRTILMKERDSDITVFVDTLCSLLLEPIKAQSKNEYTVRWEDIADRMESVLDKLEPKL